MIPADIHPYNQRTEMGLSQTKIVPGKSMDEIDAASYGAGPSPTKTKAVAVKLRRVSKSASQRRAAGNAASTGSPGSSPAPCLSLNGTWQMAEGGEAKERLRSEWSDAIPAEVPGSVHAALVAAGKLPDPTFGRNQETAEKESYKTWWLKTAFVRPGFAHAPAKSTTLAGVTAPFRLSFGGICDRCTIWLNGKKLGSHKGMFAEIAFDVTELVRDENSVIVKLDPIPSGPAPEGSQSRGNRNWLTTVVFNNVYGWHYSKLPSLGIWLPVELRLEPTVRIVGPYVTTQDTSGNADLIVELEGDGAWSGKLSGRIEPKNFAGDAFEFSTPVSGKGSRTVRLQFQLPDAHLWWPNGMGEQDLYRMGLTFAPEPAAIQSKHGNAGRRTAGPGRVRTQPDVAEFTFGLRTIEMAPLPGGPRPEHYNWTFVINGKRQFVKGSGWCTLDPLMDFRRERYDRFLSIARDQHCQMIRAWGCGMPETEDFYDLCDEYGIMVMQEWQTAWNSHNIQPYKLLEETVIGNTLRIRHRASLVMYCAGNESTNPFGRTIDMMGRLSIELDGTRPFHRGEPHGGSNHGYPCYWGREHLDEALRMESIFWGEFGSACMPQPESVRRYLPQKEQAVWPKIDPKGGFAYHTPVFNARDGVDRLSQYARYFAPDDADLDQFCVASQLAQAIALRHPLERSRTNWPNSTGALYYKINDNFPAASWATADWYGAAKIGHYWVQDAFAPVHACVLFNRLNHQGSKLTAPVYFLDDHGELEGKTPTVLVRAFDAKVREIPSDLRGLESWERRTDGDRESGGPMTVKRVGSFEIDYGVADTTPLFVVAEVRVGRRLIDRTFYILNFEAEKGCLFTRPRTKLSLAVKRSGSGGGTATVTNTGKLPAIAVEISRPGHLDTFIASDNCFWLDAGESATVKVSDADGLTVAAWNGALRTA